MNHQERIEKAVLSLEGLSLGDSFGQINSFKVIILFNKKFFIKII